MKSLFIFVENFYPAYKGGGPIQSVTNLILSLKNNFKVHVITSAYDLQSEVILEKITPNSWNEIVLPGANFSIMVWYAQNITNGFYTKLFKENKPEIIYFNGIFSYSFFIKPLIALKFSTMFPKIIICPRGMLQKGALATNHFKKVTYIIAIKFIRLINNAIWHATSEEEKQDIIEHFVVNRGVFIAANIPKKPLDKIAFIKKEPGNLRLIYLSLITEKKNLFFLLQLIKSLDNVALDIYGPVKDNLYWNECRKIINEIPDKVKYIGDVLPVEVQDTLNRYHALILLTKGENFGHALYESLSVGRPIITSDFTPWNNLEAIEAGWNLDINSLDNCKPVLDEFSLMDQDQFDSICNGAHKVAKDYYNTLNSNNTYDVLFT